MIQITKIEKFNEVYKGTEPILYAFLENQIPLSIIYKISKNNINIWIDFNNKEEEALDILNKLSFSKFYSFQKVEKIYLPEEKYIVKRKLNYLLIKNILFQAVNNSLLTSVKNRVLNSLNIPERLGFYSKIKPKFTYINDVINNLSFTCENLFIKFHFFPINYSLEEEKESLFFQLTNLEKLYNLDIRHFLKEKINPEVFKDVFDNRKINTLYLQNAFNSLKEMYISFSKEKTYFFKIEILSQDNEELKFCINLLKKLISEDQSSIEVVNSTKAIKSRIELIFTYNEIKNFLQLPIIDYNTTLSKPLEISNTESNIENIYVLENEEGLISYTKKDITNIKNKKEFRIEDFPVIDIKYKSSNSFFQKLLLNLITRILKDHISKNIPVKIFHFDSELINPLSQLLFLKSFGIYKKIENKINSIDKHYDNKNTIEEITIKIERKINKIVGKYKDIFEYNEKNKRKEEILLILVNKNSEEEVNFFLKKISKIRNLLKQIGVYFIFYGDEEINTYANAEFKNKESENLLILNSNINKFFININENIKSDIKKLLDKNIDSKDFISVPIGIDENDETVEFSLGDLSQTYHAIIVGSTGTGKTSLLGNIIIEATKKYSINDIRFILVDLKIKGVEFQKFKNCPNVEKIFLNPESESLSLKVFEYIRKEIERRGKIFVESNVINITQYNNKFPNSKLPHYLIIIDEFQRLFIDYSIEVKNYLRDIARIGRSYGFHLIMSTQTLKNVNIPDDIISQIKLRIAFNVSDKFDLNDVFPIDNVEPLYIDKYQCIYNNKFGFKEGNILVYVNPPVNNIDNIFNEIKKKRNSNYLIPEVIESNDIKNYGNVNGKTNDKTDNIDYETKKNEILKNIKFE